MGEEYSWEMVEGMHDEMGQSKIKYEMMDIGVTVFHFQGWEEWE
jgi:hypothetical protein